MLKAQNISRRFGPTFALDDVTFSVRRGEILGLIGPNGASKTTLLEIVSGLLPADSGSVLWNEGPLHPARRKQVVFYLPEAVHPYPDRRAMEVLTLFARLFGHSDGRLTSAIDDLALSSVLATRVGALSKGYRRRLLLAIGLLAPQPLIMIDEPFEGLGLKQTREIMEVLRRQRSAERTLLLSIHQLSDAERLCDRFVLVRGTGNMSLPASVLVRCVLLHIALSPVLIFGLGPLPALGPAGAGWGRFIPFAGGLLAAVAVGPLRGDARPRRIQGRRAPR